MPMGMGAQLQVSEIAEVPYAGDEFMQKVLDLPPGVRTDHFHEEVAGRRFRISAPSFFQSRADGADAVE